MARTKKVVLARVAGLLRQRNKIKVVKGGKKSTKIVNAVNTRITRARSQIANETGEDEANNTSVTAKNFHCDCCQKSYTSLSNLNQHKKTNHDNGQGGLRRFICPYCDEEQSSKFSHKRHVERKHRDRTIENVTENEYTKTENYSELTHEAKLALIIRLKKENEAQKTEIAFLKQILAQEGTEISMQSGPSSSSQQTTNDVGDFICSTELQQQNTFNRQPKRSKKLTSLQSNAEIGNSSRSIVLPQSTRQPRCSKNSASLQKIKNKTIDPDHSSQSLRLQKIKNEPSQREKRICKPKVIFDL